MSEREQRYEEALRRAKGLAGVFGDVSAERDAVMALADEEQRKLATNVTDLVAAVFRAHRENSRLYATIERVRALVEPSPGEFRTVPVEDVREALEGGE